MYKKKKLSRYEEEELPSFVLHLTEVPEEIELTPKLTKSKLFLGPVFFGACEAQHPPHHFVNLGQINLIQRVVPQDENFLDDLFLKKTDTCEQKTVIETHPQSLKRKKRKCFIDRFLHRCPGTRRDVVHTISPPKNDFGETTSKIRGETSMEIPFCRLKRVSSSCSEKEMEIVTMSDIREEKRMLMSSEERASHAHYPKIFATVQVTGPKIPASILITAIPSRRREVSEQQYRLMSKIMKDRAGKNSQDYFNENEEKEKTFQKETKDGENLEKEGRINDERVSLKEDIPREGIEEDENPEEDTAVAEGKEEKGMDMGELDEGDQKAAEGEEEAINADDEG